MVAWIRTCEICGYRQRARPPTEYRKGDVSYNTLLCKRCKRESMNYGCWATDDYGPTEPIKRRVRLSRLKPKKVESENV